MKKTLIRRMDKLYCAICDSEIHVGESADNEESPNPGVAYKHKGVVRPRKLYCGHCASDGATGYIADDFEQA